MKELTNEHLHGVCKIGRGAETCRYVITGPKGIRCAKLTDLREMIDARVAAGDGWKARGDNCEGVDHGDQS